MLIDISTILASERKSNDSAVGYDNKSMAWVIDGYNGLYKDPFDNWNNEGQWYAKTLSKYLENTDNKGKSLKEILKGASAHLESQYCGLKGIEKDSIGEKAGPFAGISLVRLLGHTAEYFQLGYPEIIVDTNHSVQTFQDERIHCIDTKMKEKQFNWENRPALLKERAIIDKYLNKQNGFWELNFSDTPIEHGKVGKFPVCDGTQILLLSKGVLGAFQPFGIYSDPKYLVMDAGCHGLQRIWNMIRHYENSDPECKKFQRIRTHENIAAAFLQIRAN